MKKLVLLLAVAFSVSMFSCGGNGEAAATEEPIVAEEVTEETIEVPDSVAVAADSVAADSVAAEAAPAEVAPAE